MQHRRIRTRSLTGLGTTALVGLGLGFAAGFVLGELFAGAGGRRTFDRVIQSLRRAGKNPTTAELTDHLHAALGQALGPDAETLELVAVGRNSLELHGWVTSRPSRTKAARVVREALPPHLTLVDRLLVWGEDDAPAPDVTLREEPETA